MFFIGETIIYYPIGVCCVKEIGLLDMKGADKKREYYKLEPIGGKNCQVYVPVDAIPGTIRHPLTREEAEELIHMAGSYEVEWIKDEKAREIEFKELLRSNDAFEWMKMLNLMYRRIEIRSKIGKRITSMEERYYKQAKDILLNELQYILNKDKNELLNEIKMEMKREEKKEVKKEMIHS